MTTAPTTTTPSPVAPTGRVRRGARLLAGTVVVGALSTLVMPAVAAVLPSPDAPEAQERVAFVARNDVAADALGVGPVAGMLGGIVITTPSGSLSDPAKLSLTEFAPDHVYIAGGAAAISDAVAAEIDALGPWTVERLAGAGRDETAYLVGKVLADRGVGRPVLTGAQVVGDSWVGGTMHADVFDLTRQIHTESFDATHDGVSPIELGGAPTDVVTVDLDLPSQGCGFTETTAYTVLVEGDSTVLTSAGTERIFNVGIAMDDDEAAYTALETTTGTGFDFANVALRGEFTIGSGEHTVHLVAETSGTDVTAVRGGLTATVVGWECAAFDELDS